MERSDCSGFARKRSIVPAETLVYIWLKPRPAEPAEPKSGRVMASITCVVRRGQGGMYGEQGEFIDHPHHPLRRVGDTALAAIAAKPAEAVPAPRRRPQPVRRDPGSGGRRWVGRSFDRLLRRAPVPGCRMLSRDGGHAAGDRPRACSPQYGAGDRDGGAPVTGRGSLVGSDAISRLPGKCRKN